MMETGTPNQFYNAILLIAFLIGAILIYFVVTIVRYHRRYVKLQKERILAEIISQENERKRIANDLHDSLGPLLSAVKLSINSIEVNKEQDKQIVSKASKHIDGLIGNVRQISYNLLPNTLQRHGLVEAIREFIDDIQNRSDLKIHLYLPDEVNIVQDKEIHIFRIMQELIHNALKHADAKNLYVGITEEENNLQIIVKDDGMGFDVSKSKKESKGFGLKSLDSRVEILNGQMSVKSDSQKGTSFLLNVPL